MELNQDVLVQVALPTAAYYKPPPARTPEPTKSAETCCWQTSLLNPKNRIDSLDFPSNPLWRIDGCIAFGTQFHAVPLFPVSSTLPPPPPPPPLRVDVFIPKHTAISPALRHVLDLGAAFHARDARTTQQLGLTRHIVRCLQHWTTSSSAGEAAHGYRHGQQLPFGSRIVLHNVPVDVRDARFSVAPTHHLERQMLSVQQLQDMWKDQDIQSFPPTIDIGELRYKSQPHDSVSIVEHAGKETVVFKAITSHTKYLYHELRNLLLMTPHPNIIERPLALVTKKCGFGSKTAVVGFTLTYHRHGTIRDHLPYLDLHNKITHRDAAKWALQLVQAARHFRGTCDTYNSDLRLDNLLLSDSLDLVMVDFEQRGVWSEFAAPEINAIECIRALATTTATDDQDSLLPFLPDSLRARYGALLTQMLPHWESLVDGEEYAWPAGRHGYNVAWQCLDDDDDEGRERCEVYMLGRVLWCLFEAQSAPQRAAIWAPSYRCEPTVEFPAYVRTPPEMRRLIDCCTRGHQPTLSSVIVRSGGKLVLRGEEQEEGEEGEGFEGARKRSTPEAVRDRARLFWTQRVADSERWVRKYIECRTRKHASAAFPNRPTLAAVEEFIEDYISKL
ncbi:Protein kinase-like domain protein [Beauveria brongniartii RCEF 3172]|uniref:Protein kinase-like domain protein n=1 Tax=Beauveria brongniartii RCEF 3172 TaxID=1081107 RepID=A0A166YUP5_9HYPO|nr:Protein kinase-like domain protein [Beauveria brongniartii RCEF 3172]